MNTVTIPKNKYLQILNTQEKLREDLSHLQKLVSRIASEEVTPEYIVKLSKIETGLSSGKRLEFKNRSGIKKFFQAL